MNKKNKNKRKAKTSPREIKFLKGFTIFELLVTFIVVAIIFLFVFVEIQPARAKTRDARRISDLNNLKASLQLFYMDKGAYPETPKDGEWCSLSEPEEEECEGFVYEFAQSLESYIDEVPEDPLHNREEDGIKYSYRYYALSSGQEYKIHAYLETREDYEIYSSKGLVINYTEEGEPGVPDPHAKYPPTVITLRSEEIHSGTESSDLSYKFILKGEIVGFGSTGAIKARGFDWRAGSGGYGEPGGENSWVEIGHFSLGEFEYKLTLPKPGPGECVHYYYRAEAQDPSAGWGYGGEEDVGTLCGGEQEEPPPADRE